MSDPWDKLPDETDTQYTHFLTYRDMGPLRNFDAAYRRVLKQLESPHEGDKRAPGFFREAGTRFRWKERAEAWDVKNLLAYGNRVAPLYVLMLERMAKRGAWAAGKYRPGDKEWGDVLTTAETVGKLLEPARKSGAVNADPPESARADAERAAAAVQSAPLRAEPTLAERLAAVE